MSLAKKLLFILPLVGIFVLVAGLLNPPEPRAQQIEEGCLREFERDGMARVRQCQLEIMAREMDQRERDRMIRAAGG